jgi:hypothetical protein
VHRYIAAVPSPPCCCGCSPPAVTCHLCLPQSGNLLSLGLLTPDLTTRPPCPLYLLPIEQICLHTTLKM